MLVAKDRNLEDYSYEVIAFRLCGSIHKSSEYECKNNKLSPLARAMAL